MMKGKSNKYAIHTSSFDILDKYEYLFQTMADGVIYHDDSGRIITANPAAERILGLNLEDIITKSHHDCWKTIHLDGSQFPAGQHPSMEALRTGRPIENVIMGVYNLREKNYRWISINAVPQFRSGEGAPFFVYTTFSDITEMKNIFDSLQETQQKLKDIIDFLPDPTFAIDKHGRVIEWNKAIEEFTGVSKRDIVGKGDYAYAVPLYGHPRKVLIDLNFGEDKECASQYSYIEKKGNVMFAEKHLPIYLGRKDVYLWISTSPLYDRKGHLTGAIATIRDITERKHLENELKYMATHDLLTKIPNRFSLEENLSRVIAKAKRNNKSALLFLDIDNFKTVNDTMGHAAGDQVLLSVITSIKGIIRESDSLYRFGGDEFVVLLEDISARDSEMVAERIRKAIVDNSFCLPHWQVCFDITMSIGIVMIDGTLDYHKLMTYADNALYLAKDSGRNRVVMIKPTDEIVHNVGEVNRIIGEIKYALKENTLILYYQPVVRMGDNRISHYETLVRIKDSADQLLMPEHFIPLAERFGFITRIDCQVVQKAFEFLEKHPDISLFINLSGISIGDESLYAIIEQKSREKHFNPHRVVFEITETAAVKDFTRTEKWIKKIKKMGFSFALDDFGIGFSSFAYLKLLPVDYLKIDGSFVLNTTTDDTQRAIIESMNKIAHALGKKTIAEFVENEATLQAIMELGVDYAQGYYFSKPLPEEELLNS